HLPAFNAPDEVVGLVDLPAPGFLSAGSNASIRVTAPCRAPYEDYRWGMGRGVVAVLEELVAGTWQSRDTRQIGAGAWPRVRTIYGPIGGVITVNSSLTGSASHPSYVDVRLGPQSAVRLGAQWRVSPSRYGSRGELWSYTNFSPTPVIFAVTNSNFALETIALPGFVAPSNQQVILDPGHTTIFDFQYRVYPPRLFYDRATHLKIAGTPNTAYRIEGAPALPLPAQPLFTAELTLQPGTNSVPSALPSSTTNFFYRALWLPDQ
ncbi:MAG TPA: hypothetical protein VNH84_20965, partial [Candidatus Saccharimonadales bacterium]|nr:hypothetical protein [Candidatus Saccharimonadales bacterium]